MNESVTEREVIGVVEWWNGETRSQGIEEVFRDKGRWGCCVTCDMWEKDGVMVTLSHVDSHVG